MNWRTESFKDLAKQGFMKRPKPSKAPVVKPCKHGYWLKDGKCKLEVCY